MLRRPRPRNASILTRGMLTTTFGIGIIMTVCLLWLLNYGESHYTAIVGSTMALTAFAAFRIVGAFESRSLTASVITPASFDSKQMNWIVLFEIVLMILVVAFDLLNKWLGTTAMTWNQWGLALAPAGILFVAWELGKLVARRMEAGETEAQPAAAEPAKDAAAA